MSDFLKKIIKFKRIVIVGITKGEDFEQYNLLEIYNKSNQFQVVSQKKYDTFKELIENRKADTPLILVV